MTNSQTVANPSRSQEYDAKALELFSEEIADLIDRKALKLPVLPEIPSRVLAMTTNPEMDISELSDLIHKDQALAGHVLRISNSAAYAGTRQIASLTQAIARLGARLVGDIAFSISLQSEVFHIKGFEKFVDRMWKQALAAGLFGKEIARIRRKNVEGQYLCGLLHAVGKPVILQAAIQLQDSLQIQLDPETAEILIEEFHASVGSILTFAWGLPDQVSKACLYYLCYEDAPTYKQEITATYISSQLAGMLDPEYPIDREELAIDPAFQAINLYPEDVERLLDKKDEVQEKLIAMAI
ncbi:MAG: HDOD domain-containing protein [Rhodothermaceae bacterium]|nr:HDOD domain-containing protein [Rhodothermaceae bacterium]